MEAVQLIDVGAPGPEDVLVGADGSIYSGVDDGRILRLSAENHRVSTVADTGGRPLGLEWLADGRLLVCDCERGLLAVDIADGTIETLIARGEHRLSFCNNAAVASDGRIFFSDSSQQYKFDEARIDVIERVGSGRLLCRHPDGQVEQLLDQLQFANGVALTADERFVFVAQTGAAAITRLSLQDGRVDWFARNLPGLPDNLARGSDGLLWLALVEPNSATLRMVQALPRPLRKVLARLPAHWLPQPAPICQLMAFNDKGDTVHHLYGDPTQFNRVTGVREHNGRLFIGTIASSAIGLISRT